MTNDELQKELGSDVMKKIDDANFVLVPKEWRDRVFKKLEEHARCAPVSS